MGGNALKIIQTFRKPRNEYEEIKKIIISKLENYLPTHENISYGTIIEAPEKEDFGDLDILVSGDSNEIFKMIEFFEPDEIQRSGNIYSFNYKDFQIDFIEVESIKMAQFFYNYGDVGSILGRIFSTYGFKFGQKGLSLHLKDCGDTVIFLSDNPEEVCRYFNYNYERWLQGFSKIDECFEWIISSKYFRKNIFFGGNFKTNKKSLQRPFYSKFLEFLNTLPYFYYKKYYDFPPAIDYFNKGNEYQKIRTDLQIKNLVHSKFNSNIFMDLGYSPEKNNLTLSKFMDKFKSEIVNFDQFIMKTDQIQINKLIEEFIIKETSISE